MSEFQAEPIGNRASACPVKSQFGKLRHGGVQDREHASRPIVVVWLSCADARTAPAVDASAFAILIHYAGCGGSDIVWRRLRTFDRRAQSHHRRIRRSPCRLREVHGSGLFSRANSSIITWRIANFWTLPVTVDGKLSTNRTYRGIL